MGACQSRGHSCERVCVCFGQVRSFSQLRNEFADVDTFYLTGGAVREAASGPSSPVRRSRSRAASTHQLLDDIRDEARGGAVRQRRARSKSRPRVLYAEPDAVRNSGWSSQAQNQSMGWALTRVSLQITPCWTWWKKSPSGSRSEDFGEPSTRRSITPHWTTRPRRNDSSSNGCILTSVHAFFLQL